MLRQKHKYMLTVQIFILKNNVFKSISPLLDPSLLHLGGQTIGLYTNGFLSFMDAVTKYEPNPFIFITEEFRYFLQCIKRHFVNYGFKFFFHRIQCMTHSHFIFFSLLNVSHNFDLRFCSCYNDTSFNIHIFYMLSDSLFKTILYSFRFALQIDRIKERITVLLTLCDKWCI